MEEVIARIYEKVLSPFLYPIVRKDGDGINIMWRDILVFRYREFTLEDAARLTDHDKAAVPISELKTRGLVSRTDRVDMSSEDL